MGVCDGCHSGCCRSFAVPVTGADILTIMDQRELSFWDFVCRWADPQGIIARKHAPHFYFRDDPATPYVICLMHRDSKHFEGTTCCQFLEEDAPTPDKPRGEARCTIYHERPMACRVFPTKLHPGGELAILYDAPEYGREGHEVYKLCPRDWEKSDIDTVKQLQDLIVSRYEMLFFHQLADSWNRQPGSWLLFPDFLKLVYESRLQNASEVRERIVLADLPKTIPMRRAA